MTRKFLCTLAMLTASVALPVLSAPVYALTASQTVEREVVTKNADGTVTVKREAADIVTPGDKVIYTIHYMNEDAQPANDIVLVMPIPEAIKFIDGSADSEKAISVYSTDGGKTFAKRKDLQVKLPNGKFRPARAEDITHVRWTVKEAIAQNESGTLSFSGLLK